MENFVSFDLAKELKEKGFNLGCIKYYNSNNKLEWSNCPWLELDYNNSIGNNISAPTISQALKWLRKEKKLSVEMFYGTVVTGNKFIDDVIKPRCSCCVVPTSENFYGIRTDLFKSTTNFVSWEEAALAGIEYTLDKLL